MKNEKRNYPCRVCSNGIMLTREEHYAGAICEICKEVREQSPILFDFFAKLINDKVEMVEVNINDLKRNVDRLEYGDDD